MKNIKINGITFEIGNGEAWLVFDKDTIKTILQKLRGNKDASTKMSE